MRRAVITAFAYSPTSGVRTLAGEPAIREALATTGTLVWVDFDHPTDDEVSLLRTLFRFHELAIEDCVAESQHPKVDDYGDYLYLVVHGVVGDAGCVFRTEELDAFVGANFVVTFHYEKRRSVEAVMGRVREVAQPMAHGADGLLCAILEQLVDNYEPAMEVLDQRIAAVEEAVFGRPDKQTLGEIFALRKEVLHLRRIIYPQRETVHRLARGEFAQIGGTATPFFRDVYDHLYRITDLCEGYRDLLGGVLDAYLSVVSNRLNEVMKVLTIISTIMLPLTVIAGIYGMNFDVMPELHWRYGYFMVLALMAAIAGGMIVFFKRRGWFD
jgi:magnesium transporter